MTSIVFPGEHFAMRDNITAWLATRSESYLQGFMVRATWDNSVDGIPSKLILVRPGTRRHRSIAASGMLQIKLIAPEANTADLAANLLFGVLPDLTGNGIAAVTDVNGPTDVTDTSGHPARLLTCGFVISGAVLAES